MDPPLQYDDVKDEMELCSEKTSLLERNSTAGGHDAEVSPSDLEVDLPDRPDGTS